MRSGGCACQEEGGRGRHARGQRSGDQERTRGRERASRIPSNQLRSQKRPQASETNGTVVVSNPFHKNLNQVREGNLFLARIATHVKEKALLYN